MTLDQLRILITLVEEGSFSAAAQKLHRTQPTMSISMKKLERALGVSILDRAQYRASLTPAGERIYARAKMVLRQAEELEALALYLAEGHEPHVGIAVETSYPVTSIVPVMQQWEREFPATQFDLMIENVLGAIERLRAGDADIAISPWMEEQTNADSFPLDTMTMVTVAAPHFPPLRKERPLKVDDLAPYVQIVIRDSSQTPSAKSYGLLADVRYWYVNDHYTKRELIAAGMGWGALHLHLIEQDLKDGSLVPLEIEHHPVRRQLEIRVIRRSGEIMGPVATRLWNDLQQHATKIRR